MKEDSHSHKQKLGSRVKLDAQSGSNHNINQIINNHNNNHNNSESKKNARIKMKSNVENSDESVKSHQNSHQYRPVAAHIKSSSNSSSGVVGGACNGCNDNCRLTISFQNKSANLNKFIKNSFEFGESSVSSRRLRDSAVGAITGDDSRYENSSTRNFSNKIWSWFSLNVNEQAAEEERQSLNKNVAAV